jgi:hypothetical protein
MELKFKVEEQTLSLVNKKNVVADSLNYLTCAFGFSYEWAGLLKTAVFISESDEVYTAVLDKEDKCEVPWEVIKSPSFRVSVYGGDLITTNIVLIQVTESGYLQGDISEEPTPEVYAQITKLIEEQIKDVADFGRAVSAKVRGESLTLPNAEETSLTRLSLFGKTTVESDVLVNVAYDGKVKINIVNENLFSSLPLGVYEGVTLSKEGDYYVLNGTATGSTNIIGSSMILPGGTYTLCANNNQHNGIATALVQVYSETKNIFISALDNKVNSYEQKYISYGTDYVPRLRIEKGAIYDNFVIKPQLVLGKEITEYIPNEQVSITVTIPDDGLPGIKVSDKGNYTDVDGQQ